MEGDRFEWDDAKAAANLVKHKLSFEDASAVFDDPIAVDVTDPYPNGVRWQRTGMVGGLLVFVVYLETDSGRIRIISARKANRHEHDQYWQAR